MTARDPTDALPKASHHKCLCRCKLNENSKGPLFMALRADRPHRVPWEMWSGERRMHGRLSWSRERICSFVPIRLGCLICSFLSNFYVFPIFSLFSNLFYAAFFGLASSNFPTFRCSLVAFWGFRVRHCDTFCAPFGYMPATLWTFSYADFCTASAHFHGPQKLGYTWTHCVYPLLRPFSAPSAFLGLTKSHIDALHIHTFELLQTLRLTLTQPDNLRSLTYACSCMKSLCGPPFEHLQTIITKHRKYQT